MPFDFSRFLRSVDSRARTVRGLSAGATAFAALSLASLAGMSAVRLLRIPFPYWALAAFVAPPLAAAAFGYAFGRSRGLRIPHLLLRIDDALGLNARLSSLYELRQRGDTSFFRRRIEAEVRDATDGWRAALPVARRTLVGGSAGALFVVLAVGLAFVPLPTAPRGSPLDMLEQSSTLSGNPLADTADSAAAPMTEAAAPLTVRIDEETGQEAGVPSLDAPDRDQTLEDVMRDLAGISPDETVIVPISPDEVEQLARMQSEAMRAITQLLEAIRDRIQDSDADASELTEEELEALQRELERRGLPPEVQEGLNELMNRPQPRSVEEIIEDLIDQFGGDEESESGAPQDGESAPPPGSTAVAPDPQGIEDFLDELGGASSEEESGPEGGPPAGPEGMPGQDSEGEGTPSSGERPPMIGAEGREDPDQFGGSEGAPGPSDEDEEREAVFIREEERIKIGPEGDFVSEFATEGVPIEWVPGPAGEAPSPQVSYERIASILRERGVPEGAVEIVRDYFNAITEGGP
jgi:hypothetical protein